MNRSLTSDREWQDVKYPILKANYKLLQIVLVNAGKSADRYASLEPECFPTRNPQLECRKGEWVEFYLGAYGTNVDVDTLPDIESCELISSENMVAAAGPSSSLSS
jgi:hypothetical protein